MRQEPFCIGSAVVEPGTRATVELPVARLYTHTEMSLTVQVIHGKRPGPRLFVSAALHGDEINGVEIIRRLLRTKVVNNLRGTLLAIPIVNTYGFIHRTRYLPDRRDLNRVFPGSVNGSLGSQIADLFMTEVVSTCTHGIDLHTGSNNRFNLPQIRASFENPDARRLADAFGAPVILHSKTRDGSLREAVNELGIPMLLYEAGEALRFDEFSIRTGVRGVISVMREIGMLPHRKFKSVRPVVKSSGSKWVRAPMSGMFTRKIDIGSPIQEGQTLGYVNDPYGENEHSIISPLPGLIIGRLQMPLVYKGDALFHIASLEGHADINHLIEELAENIDPPDQSIQ